MWIKYMKGEIMSGKEVEERNEDDDPEVAGESSRTECRNFNLVPSKSAEESAKYFQ